MYKTGEVERKGKNCSLYSLVCPDSSPLLLPTKSTDMNINWMATRMWIKTNMEMQKKLQIIYVFGFINTASSH